MPPQEVIPGRHKFIFQLLQKSSSCRQDQSTHQHRKTQTVITHIMGRPEKMFETRQKYFHSNRSVRFVKCVNCNYRNNRLHNDFGIALYSVTLLRKYLSLIKSSTKPNAANASVARIKTTSLRSLIIPHNKADTTTAPIMITPPIKGLYGFLPSSVRDDF